MQFTVNGAQVEVVEGNATLLDVLRDQLGLISVKDGCSPQGQCGCCTVWVEGQPRVACVTPARRVAGRAVTTLEGLEPDTRDKWAAAFCATGGSQCGFCTPGIIMRLEAHRLADKSDADQALLAHLCRCTGWQTIIEASGRVVDETELRHERDLELAARRAEIEGRTKQVVGPSVACGQAGFADDCAPADALFAVSDGRGGWSVGETLTEARASANKVQGRRTTLPPAAPLDVAPGAWDIRLRTQWVEPAYLEPDATWCEPGGEPYTLLANGGAFGGKLASPVGEVARRLAEEHGRAVRVCLAREDVVRLGPKRPPMAIGLRDDETGVVRVARTAGIVDAVHSVTPQVSVEEIDVVGPPTSSALRAAGVAEMQIALAGLRDERRVVVNSPDGSRAEAWVSDDGSQVEVQIECGAVLDEVVLRSYCIGAAHMGLGWVRSEGLAVGDDGEVEDLTIRSFGILRAIDTPNIDVTIADRPDEPPVNGSDAVFAAVAAADWIRLGCPQSWPVNAGGV